MITIVSIVTREELRYSITVLSEKYLSLIISGCMDSNIPSFVDCNEYNNLRIKNGCIVGNLLEAAAP